MHSAQKNVMVNEILRIIQKEGLKMMRHRCGLKRRRNIEAKSTRYKDTWKNSLEITEDNRKDKQLYQRQEEQVKI